MISQTNFVVVDLETTGLVPSLDRIIEMGAVRLRNGQIVDEWESLVNPGIFLPAEISQFTGITTDMVQDAPALEEVLPKFLSFLGTDSIFVAHSVDFDRQFLNEHLTRSQNSPLSGPYLCTVELAKHVHPNLQKYGLGALAEVFNVELPQAHRAVHDARATAELLHKFLSVLQNGGLKFSKDIPGMQNWPKTEEGKASGQGSLF